MCKAEKKKNEGEREEGEREEGGGLNDGTTRKNLNNLLSFIMVTACFTFEFSLFFLTDIHTGRWLIRVDKKIDGYIMDIRVR